MKKTPLSSSQPRITKLCVLLAKGQLKVESLTDKIIILQGIKTYLKQVIAEQITRTVEKDHKEWDWDLLLNHMQNQKGLPKSFKALDVHDYFNKVVKGFNWGYQDKLNRIEEELQRLGVPIDTSKLSIVRTKSLNRPGGAFQLASSDVSQYRKSLPENKGQEVVALQPNTSMMTTTQSYIKQDYKTVDRKQKGDELSVNPTTLPSNAITAFWNNAGPLSSQSKRFCSETPPHLTKKPLISTTKCLVFTETSQKTNEKIFITRKFYFFYEKKNSFSKNFKTFLTEQIEQYGGEVIKNKESLKSENYNTTVVFIGKKNETNFKKCESFSEEYNLEMHEASIIIDSILMKNFPGTIRDIYKYILNWEVQILNLNSSSEMIDLPRLALDSLESILDDRMKVVPARNIDQGDPILLMPSNSKTGDHPRTMLEALSESVAKVNSYCNAFDNNTNKELGNSQLYSQHDIRTNRTFAGLLQIPAETVAHYGLQDTIDAEMLEIYSRKVEGTSTIKFSETQKTDNLSNTAGASIYQLNVIVCKEKKTNADQLDLTSNFQMKPCSNSSKADAFTETEPFKNLNFNVCGKSITVQIQVAGHLTSMENQMLLCHFPKIKEIDDLLITCALFEEYQSNKNQTKHNAVDKVLQKKDFQDFFKFRQPAKTPKHSKEAFFKGPKLYKEYLQNFYDANAESCADFFEWLNATDTSK